MDQFQPFFIFDAVMFQLHSMINRLEHPQIEQLTNAQLHLILNEFNPISLWSWIELVAVNPGPNRAA